MEKPIYEPRKLSFPPETSTESMEFLSRSWSVSAQEVSKALCPSHSVFPKIVSGENFAGDGVVEEASTELEDSTSSVPTVSGNAFSFATSLTSQMVMDRIMSQSVSLYLISPSVLKLRCYLIPKQEASPLTSGRLSHSSGPLNGSLTESPPVSPYIDPIKIRSAANLFRSTPAAAGGSYSHTAVVPTGKTMGRWLKDRKEKKKQETRAQNAQIHASTSVAGVAAAVAALATATAAASATSKDEQAIKSTMAVASAATLVAAQCVEAAEAMGADRKHLASIVNSAVNVRSAGDVMTLTAAAATALRGAATLKARALKDVWNISAVIPVDRAANNDSSNGSFSGELPVAENFLGACNRELLARGCELLKRTRKGDLHWKVVSVYSNKENQVMLKMKSRHIAGTVTKKKKNMVLEVIKDMPAWPGRHLLVGGEDRRYFGLKTVSRGVVEFECMNQGEYEIWTGGVSRLLEFARTRKLRV